MGVRLSVRNYNRKPLRLLRARLFISADLIAWQAHENLPDKIRKVMEAVVRKRPAEFDLTKLVEGVSPNASTPTIFEHDFYVGIKGDADATKRTVLIRVEVDWQYASGGSSVDTEKLSIELPIGNE